MDIATITPTDRKIEILHPSTGEALGLSITLISPDDPRMRKIIRRITDQALSKRQKNKAFSAEEVETNQIALMTEAVIGWDWYGADVSFHGDKPEFNAINVRKVIAELPFVRAQLDEEMGETKSFFQI